MRDLFHEFFLAQTNKPLAEDEAELVDKALDKVLLGRGDEA